MAKVLQTISKILSRNKSTLEMDAVPVAETTGAQEVEAVDSGPVETLTTPGYQDNLALVEQNGNQSEALDLYNRNAYSTTNNVMAVNNTQGQVVLQISHVNGFQLGDVFNIGKESTSTKNRKPSKTKTIAEMMSCQDLLTHKMLDTISTHLGEGWQNVMRELDFSQGQIHQAKVDYINDGGLKEVIYQLLLDWSRNDDSANLGHIAKLLWRRGHHETVKYMKETWKVERVAKSSENTS